MLMNARILTPHDTDYPESTKRYLGLDAPQTIYLAGGGSVPPVDLAIICSVSCPGSVVIKTFDMIRDVRDAGIVVAGGFHSPMERECLHFLLRGSQQVVLCPAHGITSLTLAPNEQHALDEGRLVVASIFGDDITQATPLLACQRNDFVASVAHTVLVPHAVPGGKAESAARRALARGQTVLTLEDDENRSLVEHGASPVRRGEILELFRQDVGHRSVAPGTSS